MHASENHYRQCQLLKDPVSTELSGLENKNNNSKYLNRNTLMNIKNTLKFFSNKTANSQITDIRLLGCL